MENPKLELDNLISIVDEFSMPGYSITLYLREAAQAGMYTEFRYVNKNYQTIDEQTHTLTYHQAKEWLNKYVPTPQNCELIKKPKDVDLLGGHTKTSLFKSADGRYCEYRQKMNDWDYSILTTVIWLAPGTETKWIRKKKK